MYKAMVDVAPTTNQRIWTQDTYELLANLSK